MAFLSELSRREKETILYRCLILKQPVNQIHIDYRDRVSESAFSRVPSILMANLEYMEYAKKLLMGEKEYMFFAGKTRALSHKNVSYWENEEEMIFQHATYQSLSHEESLIYSKYYAESFQKQ